MSAPLDLDHARHQMQVNSLKAEINRLRNMLLAHVTQEWHRTLDVLPTADQADESGLVWACGASGVVSPQTHTVVARNPLTYPHWMAKPRMLKPEPPKKEGTDND